jgi:Domain of unknown function (DUF4340)
VALKMRPDAMNAAVPDQPLVAADLKNADKIVIDGPAGGDSKPAAKPTKLELSMQDGRWQLPSLSGAPANPTKVHDLIIRLAGLERGLPVATSADALDRFKVADSHYERRVAIDAGAKTLATVYLGNSAGPRKSSARTASDRVVYDVAISTFDLPTTPTDWFDHGLLHRDASKIAAITVEPSGAAPITLRRNAAAASAPSGSSDWNAEGLPAGDKLDSDKAQALAAQIANVHVDGLASAAGAAGTPVVKLTLADTGGKTQTWTLWQPKPGGDATLQASGQPWPLTLKSWIADPLLKALQPQALAMAMAPAAAAAASASQVSAAPAKHPS